MVNMQPSPSLSASDEPTARAAVLAEHHHTRWARANPHLVLERHGVDVVRAQRAVWHPELFFGTRKSEMPFSPGRRVRRTREHEMHDVVREVVIAPRDVDFPPKQPPAIAIRLGARPQVSRGPIRPAAR